MADKRMQPTWDSIALAAQLRNIAKQSRLLMRRFVSHEPDAIRFGMGGTSTLGFDFFELMTRMMTDPLAVATAQIDLFYDTLGIRQKTAERMLMLRAHETDAPKDKRFKHPDWSENAIFNFVKDSYLVAAKSILAAIREVKGMDGCVALPDAKTIQGCDRDGTQCARLQHEACNSDSGLRTPAASHSDSRKTFGVRSAPLKLLASQTNCETNTGHLALAADKRVLTQPGPIAALARKLKPSFSRVRNCAVPR
jgi:hypothetical protein